MALYTFANECMNTQIVNYFRSSKVCVWEVGWGRECIAGSRSLVEYFVITMLCDVV